MSKAVVHLRGPMDLLAECGTPIGYSSSATDYCRDVTCRKCRRLIDCPYCAYGMAHPGREQEALE